MDSFAVAHSRLAAVDPIPLIGRICGVTGLTLESRGPRARVGDLCRIGDADGGLLGEVVGFRGGNMLLLPLGNPDGLEPGAPVVSLGRPLTVPVGPGLLGRVLDGLGRPIDGKGPLGVDAEYPVMQAPPGALARQRITEPLAVGVRAIDALLTIAKGQRMGVFAGSGVGKSTLLSMMARGTTADVTVLALVGERGREVREFLEDDLGPEGLERAVVVVATSDEPCLVRIKAALAATAIAEYFRDQGQSVVLMMDSVTRLAMAQREVGLAVGEPPTSRGYTPSTFSLLPRVLERAGPGENGSITGLYTVLVDGDDLNDPVADAVRGILDGHIVLSRKIAHQGQYPAIDVLQSVSRVMNQVVSAEQMAAALRLRRALATWAEAADLVQIGAYKPGSNPDLDNVLARLPDVRAFLVQAPDHRSTLDEAVSALTDVFESRR